MGKILFGTAGIPHSAKAGSSVAGVQAIRGLGLDAMELEFVYGVRMSRETAEETKTAANENNVSLSVHAPYYINLNAQDAKKLGISRHNVLESCRIGAAAGAEIVLFHPGFYMKMPAKEAYGKVRAALSEILDALEKGKIKMRLGIETTGKGSAFGTLEENIALSEELPKVFPVVDFAHIHARGNGRLKEKKDFDALFEKIPKRLLKGLHMHISGINYTEKGERNHLNMGERGNDFSYRLALHALRDFNVSGTVICESPNLEGDALLMKKYWEKL